jgi:RNA polymerase sigma-70 factor (ECF subfamily)
VNGEQLQRLRKGDPELFAELVREHHHSLIALARPLVGPGDAEEVVQNAWLKAHGAIDRFEGRSAVRTWLSRIVLNEAKMLLRQRGREVSFSHWDDSESGEPLADRFTDRGSWKKPPVRWHYDSPDSLLMSDELADCLTRLLHGMPVNQRALFELRDTLGLSFEEICNELGISASNARVLLHRARGQLFELVDHYQETGEC